VRDEMARHRRLVHQPCHGQHANARAALREARRTPTLRRRPEPVLPLSLPPPVQRLAAVRAWRPKPQRPTSPAVLRRPQMRLPTLTSSRSFAARTACGVASVARGLRRMRSLRTTLHRCEHGRAALLARCDSARDPIAQVRDELRARYAIVVDRLVRFEMRAQLQQRARFRIEPSASGWARIRFLPLREYGAQQALDFGDAVEQLAVRSRWLRSARHVPFRGSDSVHPMAASTSTVELQHKPAPASDRMFSPPATRAAPVPARPPLQPSASRVRLCHDVPIAAIRTLS
jgi:hypothetical protein